MKDRIRVAVGGAWVAATVVGIVLGCHVAIDAVCSSAFAQELGIRSTNVNEIRIDEGPVVPTMQALSTQSSSSGIFPVYGDPDREIAKPVNGQVAYDSTDKELRAYVGDKWVSIVTK